jgi:phage/plasmid-associated DNA primase
MHKDFSDWEPRFSPIVLTNAIPVITDLSISMLRRLLEVRFPVVIQNRDDKLVEKMRPEHSGILNRLIKGARDYYDGARRKENWPTEIVASTAAMWKNLDHVKAWMREECKPPETSSKRGTDCGSLIGSYIAWRIANGMQGMGRVKFTLELKAAGIAVEESNKKSWARGVELLSQAEREARKIATYEDDGYEDETPKQAAKPPVPYGDGSSVPSNSPEVKPLTPTGASVKPEARSHHAKKARMVVA